MITKTLHWTEKNGDKSYDFDAEIVIHPFKSGIVIINCPGAGGSIDGYQNKYMKLADYMVDQGLGAVVRMSDPYNPFGWDVCLRHVIAYILENSQDICGSDTPIIYLMGASAGASAIALLAWEYPEVKKILLLEPAAKLDTKRITECLGRYTGEIVVITGGRDAALGPESGALFIASCTQALRKELITFDDADHYFSGENHSRMISQAPFYAFSDTPPAVFPDYTGGIVLYS